MTAGRRGFLQSLAVGSTACLVGCDGSAPAPACDLPPMVDAPPLAYPPADYFAQVSADLTAADIGTPVVFLDMDRIDGNIGEIVAGIPSTSTYRIVEKSLPSLDLLAHVSTVSGSDAFLVLHLPLLPALLDAFPTGEMLMGKTHVTRAVTRFFDRLPVGTDLADVARRVIFLADGPARLAELIELAAGLGVTLRVAVEIDVGLRRSGLREPGALGSMLSTFLGTSDVAFAGLLGYDGHVPENPGGHAGLDGAWQDATDAFWSFHDVLNGPGFEALAGLPDLIFHSGGTSTYPMYASGTPVNDVAAGGGVVRPGTYPNYVIDALEPAIFIATPVLRQYDAPELPFFPGARSAGFFEGRQGLTIYGGGWPASFTHPADIRPAPLVSDATDHVMVPNQGMVTAPADTRIAAGDWVFYHPRQSDALFQFEEILEVQGGRFEGRTMAPLPRRY